MRIRLTLGGGAADPVNVVLLRSADWLAAQDAREGGTVLLDLPEMGVRAQATVTAIAPCPPIPEREGRLIRGLVSGPAVRGRRGKTPRDRGPVPGHPTQGARLDRDYRG